MPHVIRRLAVAFAACLLFSAAGTAVAATLKPQTAHAYALGDRPLRTGATGEDVSALQHRLTSVGLHVRASGTYDAATKDAVVRFQRWAGLPAAGTTGKQTLAALRRAVNAGWKVIARTSAVRKLGDRLPLAQGMKGSDVRDLHDDLTKAGYRVKVTSAYTARTAAVVRTFEEKQNLEVDGVVGRDDVNALAGATDTGGAGQADLPGDENAPVTRATIRNGLAVAPADAPLKVQQIIAAGNEIASTPYVWGGGHGSWKARGYDCSGSVSYALHGAGFLRSGALVSGDLMSWGSPGRGRWVSIYANGGHTYMYVAGLRFDTSGASPSRWQRATRSNAGFAVRHPAGL